MEPTKAITPRLRIFRIVRNQYERISSFIRLPRTAVYQAPERTVIIVNGEAAARSAGVINCAGVAVVDAQQSRFGIIHTCFPDDLAAALRFTLQVMRCRPGDPVIGITGLKGYTVETQAECLATAGMFGRVIFARLGASVDIAVDYQARRIFGITDGRQAEPATRFAGF
jgi:hypothetical protein